MSPSKVSRCLEGLEWNSRRPATAPSGGALPFLWSAARTKTLLWLSRLWRRRLEQESIWKGRGGRGGVGSGGGVGGGLRKDSCLLRSLQDPSQMRLGSRALAFNCLFAPRLSGSFFSPLSRLAVVPERGRAAIALHPQPRQRLNSNWSKLKPGAGSECGNGDECACAVWSCEAD